MEEMLEFEKNIGYVFKDKKILEQAMTHKSYTNENTGAEHNERLELFGDAILQFQSTKYLFDKYKDEQEGTLTSFRSALVDQDALLEVAAKLDVAKYVRVSVGQRKELEKKPHSFLADVIEALIAAIYIDGGEEASFKFIENHILNTKELTEYSKDAKTELQELLQAEFGKTPAYYLIKESGPDHDKVFTIAVQIDDKEIGRGNGNSKQIAEKAAAENALKLKKW